MKQDYNLEFIKGRIAEIRSALLFNLSADIDKIPTSIVSAMQIDEEGQIWFMLSRPRKYVNIENGFPAHLQFYRKGKPFYVHVTGEATIVEDPQMFNRIIDKNAHDQPALDQMLLVRLKMGMVEYHEQKTVVKSENLLDNLYHKFIEIFWDQSPIYAPIHIRHETAPI